MQRTENSGEKGRQIAGRVENMEIMDLKFKSLLGYDKTASYRKMLFDDFHKTQKSVAEEILLKSKDTEEFIDLYLGDERVRNFYARNRIAREYRPDLYWKTIRGFIGENQFKVNADAGSVKIGNENFSMLIPNGRGDGITRVAVIEDGEELQSLEMDFFTTITGKFDIFDYDCGQNPIVALDGKYCVYNYDGFVIFAKKQLFS